MKCPSSLKYWHIADVDTYEKASVASIYDSLMTVFTNLGMITALVCVLAIADRWNAEPVNAPVARFRLFMCSYPEFRNFVVQTMQDDNTGDVGTYQHELFNCTVALGDVQLNVCKTVTESKFKRDEFNSLQMDSFLPCLEDQAFQSACMHLFENFPEVYMNSWMRLHLDKTRDIIKLAQRPENLLSWAAVLLFTSMLLCVMAVLALSLSPAKWDHRALEIMLRCWAPVIVVVVLLVIAGTWMYFVGINQALVEQAPFQSESQKASIKPMLFFAPATVVGILLVAGSSVQVRCLGKIDAADV